MYMPRGRRRGFSSVLALGIVALLAVGGVILYASGEDRAVVSTNTPGLAAQTQESEPEIGSLPTPGLNYESTGHTPSRPPIPEALRSELEMATKSGGVNPSRFNSMLSEIEALAESGVDVAELRAMLGKVAVGGATAQKAPAPPPPPPAEEEHAETRPFWEYDPSRTADWHYWAREGAPPACPEPLVLPSPVDLSLVASILYPGQVRGDGPEDFKPHGGFILKAGNTSVALRAPMDGYLTAVAKFTDEFGLHYGLTFQHPCGIQFGGGHFGVLPPDIQAVVDTIPLKGFGESRTESVISAYFVKKGQVIVTGLQEKVNRERPGFDWGVADLRSTNAASADPRFRSLYGYAPWNTYYGVCWFDLLPPEQETIVRSFPGGDYREGKNSEYCK